MKTIDFDKVFIEVMIIETANNHCNKFSYFESRNSFRKIMKDPGNIMFEKVVHRSDLFIHPPSRHLEVMEKTEFKAADWNKAVLVK